MGSIGFRELLVILVIALLIFGGKKLRTIGSDLGAAVHEGNLCFEDQDAQRRHVRRGAGVTERGTGRPLDGSRPRRRPDEPMSAGWSIGAQPSTHATPLTRGSN